MIKHTLLVVSFFLSAIAFSQDLSITNNLPASGTAGQAITAGFTLTKSATMGSFAKFQMDLPVGFLAESIELKGGNFTFENNRVKIVWVSLPGDASFTFTVKIIPSGNVSGSVTLAPQFFYLEDNVKKEYSPSAIAINFEGGNATADNTGNGNATIPSNTENNESTSSSPDNNTSNNTSSTESTPETTNATNNTTTTPTETAKTSNTTPVSNPPVTNSNVVYHVQVYALSIKPNKAKFAGYGSSVKIVEDAGLYKVLLGNFKTLQDARKYKAELLSKGMVGCFVVAYENGVHIKI